jgi:hypothetical protein
VDDLPVTEDDVRMDLVVDERETLRGIYRDIVFERA